MTANSVSFLAWMVLAVSAGDIWTRTSCPIALTHNNAGEISAYTFHFQTETLLAKDVRVVVGFPKAQYASGLGIAQCQAYFLPDSVLSCQVTDSSVEVTVNDEPASSEGHYSLTILGVQNPSSPGTTSPFSLEVFRGPQPLDFTDLFSQVAIAPAAVRMPPPQIACTGVCKTGEVHSYRVAITLATRVERRQRLVLTVPREFLWTGSCESREAPNVSCVRSRELITLADASGDWPLGLTLTVELTDVRNPLAAGRYGHFAVSVYEEFANTLIAKSEFTPGPEILTSALVLEQVCPSAERSYCSLTELHLTAETLLVFTITARTSNQIPRGGVAVVEFSEEFGVVEECGALQGLTSEADALKSLCQASGKKAVFHAEDSIPGGSFLIHVKLTTPSVSSGSVFLRTCADAACSSVIDAMAAPTPITMEGTRKMRKVDMLWSSQPRAEGTSQLSFLFQPSVNFTKTSGGRIRIRLPADSGIQLIGSPTYDICGTSKIQTSLESSWSVITRLIDIPLVEGTEVIPSTCVTSLVVTAGGSQLRLPSSSGQYPLEISLNDGSADVESALHWFTVGPQGFASGAVSSLLWEAGSISVLEVELTVAGSVESDAVVSVEFGDEGGQFPAQTKVACREKGRGPLNCTLTLSTPYPTVTAFLLRELKPTSTLTLEIAGIRTARQASSRPELTVTLLTRAQLPLYSGQFRLPEMHFVPHPSSRSSVSPVSIHPVLLGRVASMNFTVAFQSKVAANSAILLWFPPGFGLDGTALGCKVGGRETSCHGFTDAGLVVVNLAEPFSEDTELPLRIDGIQTPAFVPAAPSLSVDLVSAHKTQESVNFSDWPVFLPAEIAAVTVSIDSNEAENLDTTYYFLFTVDSPLSVSHFRLSFPSEYSLKDCRLTCEVNSSPAECGADDNSVGLLSAVHGLSVSFTVKIAHIRNPAVVGWTSDFALELFTATGELTAANYRVPGISITQKEAKAPLLHLSTTLAPSNRNFLGDFSMTFLPSLTLPVNSTIEVYFPADYFRLPDHPNCELAAISLSRCSVSGAVLSLTTASRYLRGVRPSPVTVTLHDLQSVDPPNAPVSVAVKVYYDGEVIDESPQTTLNRTIAFTEESKGIDVLSFDYSPKTASEPSIYQFRVRPTSDFYSNCTFGVRFGVQFPRRLNSVLQCFSPELSPTSSPRTDCYQSNRTVVFPSTRGWRKSEFSNFSIAIERIVNPSAGTSIGPIVFFSQCGDSLLDYATFTTAHTPALTPRVLALTEFKSSTLSTGAIADVALTAQLLAPLPPAQQDLVLVDFPPAFDLDFVQDGIKCKSGLFRNVTGVPCEYDLGRVAIAAFPPVFDRAEGGKYSVVIAGVENPWETGQLVYPTVSIHDSSADTVVAKSAPNVCNLPPLSYSKSLFNIEANQNRPWVQNRGTQSDAVSVTLETPAPQEFAISLKSTYRGISLVPYAVTFEKGKTRAEFRLSVSQNAAKGNYTLEWNVNGAWGTPIYAARRFVLVVTDLGNEKIMVSSSENVIQGGASEESTVVLQHAPASELILRLVKLSPQPTSLRFLPDLLRFGPGEDRKHFSILVAEDSFGDIGEFFIYKEGENADSYYLPKSVFSFKVIPREDSPPRFTNVRAVAVSRTKVTFKAVTDKPTTLLWMVAQFGGRTPSQEEVRNRTYNGTVDEAPRFEKTSAGEAVMPRHYEYLAEFTGLRAQTRYSIFILIDELTREDWRWQRTNFTTSPYFRSAYSTLRFDAGALTNAERNSLLSAAAEALDVGAQRLKLLEERALNSTLSTPRQSAAKAAFYHLLLVTDPYYGGETPPATVLGGLQAHKRSLKTSCPSFNDSSPIEVRELQASAPIWKGKITVGEIKSESVRLDNILLASTGEIHMCVIPRVSNPSVPLSWQISRSLDALNLPCWHSASFRTTPSESSLLITSLDRNTQYWAFFTADNALPGLPDLMSDAEVAAVTFQTLERDGESLLRGKDGAAGTLVLSMLIAVW